MASSTSTVKPGSATAMVRGYCLRALPWVKKGSFAFLDQCLISGSNFLLAVLLARWMTAAQYGAYALAFSVFFFLAGAHESLVTEPMTVFGPSSYRNQRREYLGMVLWVEGALGVLLVGVLASAMLIARHFAPKGDLAPALAGLSFSTPCVFLFWVARYAFYLEQRPGRAATGSALYSFLLLTGTFLVFRRGALSPFLAFVIMALAALVSAVMMLIRLKPALKLGGNTGLTSVWATHWHYGRWALGTACMRWIPGNVFYTLTGSLLGLADVGRLKALLNFALPLAQTVNSFGMVFQPHLSGIFGKKGRAATRGPVFLLALTYLGGGIMYLVFISVCRVPIFHFLYGGKFVESAHLVPLVCCGAVLIVVSYPFSIGLRAIQSPSSIFLVYSVAGGVSVIVGTVAVWSYGLSGAIGCYILSGLTVAVAASVVYLQKVSVPTPNPCPGTPCK